MSACIVALNSGYQYGMGDRHHFIFSVMVCSTFHGPPTTGSIKDLLIPRISFALWLMKTLLFKDLLAKGD